MSSMKYTGFVYIEKKTKKPNNKGDHVLIKMHVKK